MQQTQVLLDLFASVVDDSSAIQTSSADGTPLAADAHRLVLFLFVQYYTREASRADTADIWPSDNSSASQLEPSSPMKLAARPWVKEQPHHRAHLPATRQKMQEHLLYEESVINGFGAFVSRHAAELVALAAVGGAAESTAATAAFGARVAAGAGDTGVLSDNEDIFDASASEMDEQPIEENLTSVEIDRIGFLLHTAGGGGGGAAGQKSSGGGDSMQEDAAAAAVAGNAANVASPMDLCDTPPPTTRANLLKPLSTCLPATLATSTSAGGDAHNNRSTSQPGVSVAAMINWVRTSLGPTDLNGSLNNRNNNGGTRGAAGGGDISGAGAAAAAGGGDVPMFGASPPQARFSMFDQLVPPTLSLLQPLDVHGVHRATVLRGESDFILNNNSAGGACGDVIEHNIPSNNTTFRVLDCHDAVVYCLAPIDYATISCCTDCVIVLGAAGKAVRVERCERVQVVVAAQHVVINTCHDCIFYLAVNRPPVLLGDNRFVQLAPHNAGYDHLQDHVTAAGVHCEPKAWCNVTPLLPDQHQHAVATKHHNAMLAGGGSYGSSPPSNMAFSFQTANTATATAFNAGSSEIAGGSSSSPITLSLSPLKMPSPRSPSLAPLSSSPSAVAGLPATAASGGGVGSPSEPGLNYHYQGGVSHPPSATLLPPAKLLPFLVPFTGGKGPLCGGPMRPRSAASNMTSDPAAPPPQPPAAEEDLLGGLLGGAGTLGAEALGPTPFPLPDEYAASWEERMNGMTAVRSAYRQAGLDDVRKREFIGAIQANFKEWLQAGSGMRMKEVYDLARAEKEEAYSNLGGGGSGSGGS
jgi:Tubulin binding cofactor C